MMGQRLRQAWRDAWRHPGLCLLSIAVDFIFLVAFVMSYTILFSQTSDHIAAINSALSQQTADFVATQNPQALALSPETTGHYQALLWGIGAMLLTLYLLWTLTQAPNWWAAHKAVGEKPGFLKVLWRMSWINLVWLVLFVLILGGSVWAGQESSMSPVPLIGPDAYTWLAGLLVVILAYFMTVSYSLLTRTNPLRCGIVEGFRHAKLYIPLFLIAVAGTLLLGYVVTLIGNVGSAFGLLGIALLLAWIAYCRVLFSLTAQKLHQST